MNIGKTLEQFDSPITKAEEDLLERSGFVESVARILESAPATESNVFALYGEWGAGKTSLKNLVVERFDKLGDSAPIVVEFNPWAFSGQEQILEAFFSEIGKAIGKETKGEKAAENFKKLGAYLSYGAKTAKAIHVGLDLFGIPGSKLVGLVGDAIQGGSKDAREYGEDIDAVSKESLEHIHESLKLSLVELGRSLLIVIDDLDRLTPDQVLLMFQLVKLNGSLPRINYLLLMDRQTIEERLGAKQLGAEFIEKIVQFELTLPHVTQDQLKTILLDGLKFVLDKFAEEVDWERWNDTWTNACQNIFTTLRRIKRFLHTFRFHFAAFQNEGVIEVNPVDLFLVEVLRKFAPEVHSAMPTVLRPMVFPQLSLDFLIGTFKENQEKFGEKEHAELTQAAPKEFKNEVARILELLFPQIRRGIREGDEDEWIRDARICHELFFESYFRLLLSKKSLTQRDISQIFHSAADGKLLRQVLSQSYEKVGLHHLLMRIQCAHEKLDPQHLPVLLGEIWRLDELDARLSGIERKWDTRSVTQGFTRFLFRKFASKEDRCRIAIDALQRSESVYPLARMVHNGSSELKKGPQAFNLAFDKDDLETLRKAVIETIRAAAQSKALLEMPDLSVLLFFWRHMESKEAVIDWLSKLKDQPKEFAKALSTFVGKSTATGLGGTRVHYAVSREALERFFEKIEELEPLLAQLQSEPLSQWEKFAVGETLKRIDEKRRGLQEPDWTME